MKIEKYLEQYKGQEVWFKPNPGNGGDALIAYAALVLLRKHCANVRIVQAGDDLTNQIVFYCGGGNLVSYYNHCADFLNDIHKRVKAFILLPHTVEGHRELLSALGANVTIICREQKSFDYVSTFPNIGLVELADDLVFDLNMKTGFSDLKPVKNLMSIVTFRSMLSGLYRGNYKLGFYLRNRLGLDELDAFREDVERTSDTIHEGNVDITGVVNLNPAMDNFELIEETSLRIFRFLNQFSIINTNRLHVGIAGALLGKTVNFYGNAYHKNESVYKYSMLEKFPNVHWKGRE